MFYSSVTVFVTVFSGVLTYVLGQFALKLLVEPVFEMKKTIGDVSHFLVENFRVIANPGVPPQNIIEETSLKLRKLSAQLHKHIFLIPSYDKVAFVFNLPERGRVLAASKELNYLSNGVFSPFSSDIHERNAKAVEKICDSLGIYWPEENCWPKN